MASNYNLSAYMDNLQMEEAARQRSQDRLYQQSENAQNRAYQSSRDLMNQWAREDEMAQQHANQMEYAKEMTRPQDELLAFNTRKWVKEVYNYDLPDGATIDDVPAHIKAAVNEIDRKVKAAESEQKIAESTLAANRANFGNEWTTDVRGQYNAQRGPDGQTNPMGIPYNTKTQQDRYAADIAAGLGTGDNRFNIAAIEGQERSLLDATESANIGKNEAFSRLVEGQVVVNPNTKYVADADAAARRLSFEWQAELQEKRDVSSYIANGYVYRVPGSNELTILNKQAAKDVGVKQSDTIKTMIAAANQQSRKASQLLDIATDTMRSAKSRAVIQEAMSPEQIAALARGAGYSEEEVAGATETIVAMAQNGNIEGALSAIAGNFQTDKNLEATDRWASNIMSALLATVSGENYYEPVGQIPQQVAQWVMVEGYDVPTALEVFQASGGRFSGSYASAGDKPPIPSTENRKGGSSRKVTTGSGINIDLSR